MGLGRGKVINLIGKAEMVQTAISNKNLHYADLFLTCNDKIANSLLSDLMYNIFSQ